MLKELGQEDYVSLLRGSLATIKKLKAELAQQKKVQEPIAIIGMGCRFPGGCHGPETFWQFLIEGGDGVIEFPRERFRLEDLYDLGPNATGKMYLKETGFLRENVGNFDARFFGISPREAVEMDPQQRLLLEVSWEALERAGIPPKQIKGTQTGVFIGVPDSEYALLPREDVDISPYRLTGTIANIASGRISYILGVHGPSISVDTACSSSLVAVHLACESLQRGESSLALAGGVSLMIAPFGFISLCALHALAKDGRCKTFDVSGDGYGWGEGCGVVVLKRLSDAWRDNDPILAVIRGTGVNQDGPGSGLTVPNGSRIQKMIEEHRASHEDCNDLLSVLLNSRSEDGQGMSDKQIRDEVITLFIAGHEATASILTWAWYLLAEHPAIYDRVTAEIDDVLQGRQPTYADLVNLPYALQVLKETMRLYPPAFAIVRSPLHDTEITGYPMHKSEQIMISIYAMHRSEECFPNPEAFDPERFTPENEKKLPRYAYMPFGAGSRICIGNHFALMEGHLLLATLAQQVRFDLIAGQHPLPDISKTIPISPNKNRQMVVRQR